MGGNDNILRKILGKFSVGGNHIQSICIQNNGNIGIHQKFPHQTVGIPALADSRPQDDHIGPGAFCLHLLTECFLIQAVTDVQDSFRQKLLQHPPVLLHSPDLHKPCPHGISRLSTQISCSSHSRRTCCHQNLSKGSFIAVLCPFGNPFSILLLIGECYIIYRLQALRRKSNIFHHDFAAVLTPGIQHTASLLIAKGNRHIGLHGASHNLAIVTVDSGGHIHRHHRPGAGCFHHLYNLPSKAYAKYSVNQDMATPRQKILPFHHLHPQILCNPFLKMKFLRSL